MSIDKAWLRAVFRGGSVVDGCGTAAQTVLRRCLRLFAAGGLLLAAMAKNSSRRTPTKGLRSGETERRMCVTTLLEMPSGRPRD